jgi:hypothetical protein
MASSLSSEATACQPRLERLEVARPDAERGERLDAELATAEPLGPSVVRREVDWSPERISLVN